MRAIALLVYDCPPPLPVNFVYARRSMMPQKLRAFIDFASPRLSARIAGC